MNEFSADGIQFGQVKPFQKSELLQNLERHTGKKLQAKYSVDASLLGGALVRIGDTIYDGSLRNRLKQMRERLGAE